ncbi:MAG: HAD-IIIA family hydrolase [Deltaproteobacteria bacterium]|nr:HAD-IIIA family hydrolase [Deltaproteobacteria bacterium]
MLLDRDGVLNAVVVDPEQGTIDSPLHPAQVVVPAAVPVLVRRLHEAGYLLSVVTNQPSAAKGKTTRANLEAVHARVLEVVTAGGARIHSSHVCFHRAEDGCACRKPRPGMLEDALRASGVPASAAWMVGDGVTDVEAGRAAGTRTGFIGPRKCDACRVLADRGLEPDWWGEDLGGFVDALLVGVRRAG